MSKDTLEGRDGASLQAGGTLSALPKLREDLIIGAQQSPAGMVYVLKDPAVGRFVRFKEPEYFISQQLDGKTALDEVRRRAEERFGGSLSEDTLKQFTGKLATLGLLESPPRELPGAASKRQGKRLRGNIFYLRFRLCDPDQFLERLVPKLRFLFTQEFAWFSIAVIFLAASVTITSWDQLHHNLPRLYTADALFLAWLSLVGIIVGHEFSHGLTCKRFGGKVHEIGLLIIYLQPAMYCNVSDAWLFQRKSHRLLVTLAGAWFEVFCWALATLLWRLTDPATFFNYLMLVVATTLGIKSLFNLNPLIKLDGYYLLSDFLEVPNLRRNAYRHIGRSLRWIFQPARRAAMEVDRRVRRIYWIYGLLAAAYSAWLITFILLALGRHLMARYQAWGFAAFSALLLILFRRPVHGGLALLASHLSWTHGILKLMKRLARTVALLAVAGACLYFIRLQYNVSGEFTILPIHDAEVRAEVEGIVEEVLRDEGDAVQAGEVIARLSDRDYRTELEKAKAQIREKEAKLNMLRAGARTEEIELARTAVTKGEERLKFAQDFLGMEEKLYKEKLSSKKDYETAAELAALRARELEENQGGLKLLLAGARPEEIQATEAEIARLTSEKKFLEEQLQRLRIVSPISGVVTTHRLKEKIGADLKKGDLFAEVHQLQTVNAEISVPEKEIADVSIGQPVFLKARAYVNRSFVGSVVSISPVASKAKEGPEQRNFLVVTRLDNSEQLLRPEMSGNAKIQCGERRLYEIVFRRLIRFVRVEFWSWW